MKESIIDLINDTLQLLLIEKINNDIIKAFNNNCKLIDQKIFN